MAIPTDVTELTTLFARIGARDPESWASSQITGGIKQLHRFLFLRQAWSSVLAEGDTKWIAAQIEHARTSPTEPYSGVGFVDGGVVFFERLAFDAVGGYDEDRDVGEDVHFLLKLRHFARSRGATMRFSIGTPATISTRKWDEHGDWHMFAMAYWPLIQRRSFHAIVRDYWYRERL